MRTVSLLVALLVLAPLVAAGHVATARYVAGPELLRVTVGLLNLGGAQFAPRPGETSVTITVVDDHAGPGVGITVCQHPANDETGCGDEPGEPDIAGCSPLTLAITDTGGPVGVWIATVTGAVVGCTELPATRGDIIAVFE